MSSYSFQNVDEVLNQTVKINQLRIGFGRITQYPVPFVKQKTIENQNDSQG